MNNLVYLEPSVQLRPGDAVAAIIHTIDSKVLLQKRDNLPTIFYPNYWGFFGGAIDDNENSNQAIKRELLEELSFDFHQSQINKIGIFNFNVDELCIGNFVRTYYSILIKSKDIDSYKLGEGADIGLFNMAYALENLKIVPYDAFMLWMFCYANKLKVGDSDAE
jgi:8-oxo-dGTP pyrophosphatase MutT (NUDIX family)